MCNCAGIQVSNCAGSDCKCGVDTFNKFIGLDGMHSNAIGTIEPIKSGVTIQTAIPTVKITAQQQKAATTPTATTTTQTKTLGEKLGSAVELGTSILGMFGKKPAATTTPVPLPEEEKKVPTAVWVVVGGLLLLVVVFVIVKVSKK